MRSLVPVLRLKTLNGKERDVNEATTTHFNKREVSLVKLAPDGVRGKASEFRESLYRHYRHLGCGDVGRVARFHAVPARCGMLWYL